MIGNIIKEERNKKNITQEDLAKHIGVSPSTIGMYEQNRRQPDNETLVKLSDFFNVTIDYILGKTAFKNQKELLESWGYRGDNFEPTFDFDNKKIIRFYYIIIEPPQRLFYYINLSKYNPLSYNTPPTSY